MSDMEQLVARLAKAAWSEMKAPPHTHWKYEELNPGPRSRVDRTVGAVLRELAVVLEEESRDYASLVRLRDLADLIENGGTP